MPYIVLTPPTMSINSMTWRSNKNDIGDFMDTTNNYESKHKEELFDWYIKILTGKIPMPTVDEEIEHMADVAKFFENKGNPKDLPKTRFLSGLSEQAFDYYKEGVNNLAFRQEWEIFSHEASPYLSPGLGENCCCHQGLHGASTGVCEMLIFLFGTLCASCYSCATVIEYKEASNFAHKLLKHLNNTTNTADSENIPYNLWFLNGQNANIHSREFSKNHYIGKNRCEIWAPSILLCIGDIFGVPLCMGNVYQRVQLRNGMKEAPMPISDTVGAVVCSCCSAWQNSEEAYYQSEPIANGPSSIDLQVLSHLLTFKRNQLAANKDQPVNSKK